MICIDIIIIMIIISINNTTIITMMIMMMFDYDFFSRLGNAVMRMIETGVEGVQFAAINTGSSYDGGDCDNSYDDDNGGKIMMMMMMMPNK